ncbi:MAG: nucleotidyltransferase domain-containing protein [Candidatus Micrarchaeia archaeon]
MLGVVLSADGLHLREIARRAKVSAPEAKRELENLTELGVLSMVRKGNLCVYFLRENCPFLGELTGLYFKTEGVVSALKTAFEKIQGIKYAFVFGSFASGKIRQKSDVDVLTIGNANEEEISKVCFKIQKKSGWEINCISWTQKDFEEKLKSKSAFLLSLKKKKRLWLVGDEIEFKRLVAKT